MSLFPRTLLSVTCLALVLNSPHLLASQGNGNNKKEHSNNDNNSQGSDSQGQKKHKSASNSDDDEYMQQRYDDDVDTILRVFGQNSGRYGEVESLPPGIRKNLARGKPLPPGIAKKLNSDITRQLPNYRGYEWQQVGSDAVLTDITTGVVREIMRDILR
jgi:Ni/Co efflux regulator RcnB